MLKIFLNALYCIICMILFISALEWGLLKATHIDLFREGMREAVEIMDLHQ